MSDDDDQCFCNTEVFSQYVIVLFLWIQNITAHIMYSLPVNVLQDSFKEWNLY